MILVGWIQNIKKLSKISFLSLRTYQGLFSVVVKQNKFVENLKRESLVKITILKEKSDLIVIDLIIIKEPITNVYPFELEDLKLKSTLKTRLDYRFFDLRRNSVLFLFKFKAKIIQNIRNYLIGLNFLEVNTPKIISTGSEGGSQLFKLQYFEKLAYLAQSPQLYKQILINAGFKNIFEINYVYRAQKSDTPRHLTEAMCLDVEFQCSDFNDLIKLMKNILKNSITDEDSKIYNIKKIEESDFGIVTYNSAISLLNLSEKDEITHIQQVLLCNKLGVRFCFIIEWPNDLKPFYIKKKEFAYALDLVSNFAELSSGGLREDNYNILFQNIKEYNLNPSDFDIYLESFKFSPPFHGGFAIGLQRFICDILNLSDIKEVVLFPRDKHITKP